MIKFYTKKLHFVFFLVAMMLLSGINNTICAQATVPISFTSSNGMDLVTSATNGVPSDINYYTFPSFIYDAKYVYPDLNYRTTSNPSSATNPFPAGLTQPSKIAGSTAQFTFLPANSTNAYLALLNAGNSNDFNFNTSQTAAMSKFYMIYTYVATSGATAVGSVLFKLTYSDNTTETSTPVAVYDYRRAGMAASGNAYWPVSVVEQGSGKITNNVGSTIFHMNELDLTSYFVNMKTKTPQKLQIINNNTGEGVMYVHIFAQVKSSKIQGTVYCDNTNDATANGTGTGAAAGYVSCVDASNKVLNTTTVAADGTYTLWGSTYSGTSYKVVLTTTQPTVGSTLASSSLASGWVSGTTANASNSGDGSTSVVSITRISEFSDNTDVNFSVHKLPTAYNRTVNMLASGLIRPGALFPLNVTASGDNVSMSLQDKLLDLSVNGGQDNTASTADLNGASTNEKFWIPTALTDGSLSYNGATVSTNTIYPSSSTTYDNTQLYYAFSTAPSASTKQQFTFTYKVLDKLNFISSNTATYTINLPTILPVTYSKELTAIRSSNNQIDLAWTTATEINNNHFEVQRSANNTDRSAIATVKSFFSNGTSSAGHVYTYSDKTPFFGYNYYRLNQVDIDGKNKIGRTVVMDLQNTGQGNVTFGPNPVIDNLQIKNLPQNAKTVVVYSIDGRLVKQVNISGATADVPFANLVSASYIINVLDGNGKRIKPFNVVKK